MEQPFRSRRDREYFPGHSRQTERCRNARFDPTELHGQPGVGGERAFAQPDFDAMARDRVPDSTEFQAGLKKSSRLPSRAEQAGARADFARRQLPQSGHARGACWTLLEEQRAFAADDDDFDRDVERRGARFRPRQLRDAICGERRTMCRKRAGIALRIARRA